MKPLHIIPFSCRFTRLFFPSAMLAVSVVCLTLLSSYIGAAENGDPRTRGKLAILGVKSEESIKPLRYPKDSFLVLIPPAEEKKPNQPVTADTAPMLASAASLSSSDTAAAVPSERLQEKTQNYFVCLINHLPSEEIELLSDAKDGKWDTLSFLDAVLIADGISSEERALCRKIYDSHLIRLQAKTVKTENDFEKAKIVYEYLHQEILTGSYNLNISSAAASLQTGTYNCVSATALFNALANDVGLTSYGLEMTGHAKSRVLCGNSYLDIETTCPKWDLLPDKPHPIPENELGTETARRDAEFIKQVNYIESSSSYPSEENGKPETGLVPNTSKLDTDEDDESLLPVTPERALALSGKKPVRTVTPVQFVATIYYNRAVDFYQGKKFDSAIYAYLKAIAIDPNNETVLGNFKATLNNLAIELASRNRNYAEAIRLTEQGMALDPNFDQFRVNLPLYYQHWSAELRKNNQIEAALKVEARFRRTMPEIESKIY